MKRSLWFAVVWGCVIAANAEVTTWTQAVSMSAKDEVGRRALVDLSYWTDPSGNAGSGTPAGEDVLDVKERIRIDSASDILCGAKSVILTQNLTGDSIIVQDQGGTIGCANDGFVLRCGTWFCNKGDSVFTVAGRITAETSSSSPFVLRFARQVRNVRRSV